MKIIEKHIEKIEKWAYEFKHGHPFLLSEEVDIICDTRADEKYKWMDDYLIQKLIKVRVREMYKKKYPNAKRYSLSRFIGAAVVWTGLLRYVTEVK